MCVTQISTVSLQPDSAYLHVCPGDNVQVNCSSTTTYISWKLSVSGILICAVSLPVDYGIINFSYCGLVFSLYIVSANSSGGIIHSATVADVGLDYNGSVLTCCSPVGVANITVFVEGITGDAIFCHIFKYTLTNSGLPSAPISLKLLPQSLTSLIISWIPLTSSHCIINYIITLTNITEGSMTYTYNTTTNTTNMTVSDLIQGAEYSISVAGVDTEGVIGNNTLAKTVTLDSEWKAVINN